MQERTVITLLLSLLILGLAVKNCKGALIYRMENLTLIVPNNQFDDFYSQLDEKDIELGRYNARRTSHASSGY